jgi:hypothetical protein
MHRVRVEDLPFLGLSHAFVGAEQGNVGVSAYLVTAPPGRGPRLHRHPYDKVASPRRAEPGGRSTKSITKQARAISW